MLTDDFFSDHFGGLLYGLGITDFAMPIGFICWALLFIIGLKKIDYGDPMTGSLYAIYCSSAGVVLVLAIPYPYTKVDNIYTNLTMMIIFSAIAIIRWNDVRKYQQKLRAKSSLLHPAADKKGSIYEQKQTKK